MPHFFIDKSCVNNEIITISDMDNYNHIVKSLRTKIGEDLLLIDNEQIQYEGTVISILTKSIEVKIKKSYKSKRNLNFELYLAQSPLRSDAQSLIIEKATELGVEGVYPIYTDNCSLKKNIIEQKIQKWQKIMIESSKQCERAYVPTCFKLQKMDKLVLDKKFDRIFAFTERSAKHKLRAYLEKNPIMKNQKILIIIGPEGGFSDNEFAFFEKNKITTLSLGDLILRAETAVIVALGNIVL